MRKLLLGLLICCFTTLYSQHTKVNFSLKYALEKEVDNTKLFPLFVTGEVSKIKSEVLRLKGEVVRSVNNIVQVKLPVSTIEEFSKNDFVQSLPYSFSKGQILSDTMLIHNNVTPIHNGVSPLLQRYTGKGVVFGIIDSGQDIVHPDFKDTLGRTRIYRIWDQVTGEFWDSTAINNGTCTHVDNGVNHGTQVSGIGSGNGLAVNEYAGVAGESTIIAVASDFNASNWLSTFVDAADYIYKVADSLGMPCVVNASLGTYFGSHDATDPAAVLLDSIVNYKPGRAFVCAGGNAGYFNWHLGQDVTADTSFTWLKYNPTSAFGFGSVFYEVWSDTADFNNVEYAFGANLPYGSFEERGRTPFFNIQNRLGSNSDTIMNGSNILAIVETYGEIQDDKYLLQVMLNEPDSNTYNFSILSTGLGKFDFWSTSALGTSDIVESGLPSVGVYPNMVNYQLPDSAQTIVSSFSCSPNLITVANFVNRKTYLDINLNEVVGTQAAGSKSGSSSLGPNRRGLIKPDIGATGDFTLGARSAANISAMLGAGQDDLIGIGGMHAVNGGTSMASPVVAGIVALYLEKCPNASMIEIKSAILGSGKQDNFTGTLPNNAFGYGKVDAFAALNLSNSNLTLGDELVICGDTITQITSPPSITYLWSNGDTTQNVTIDSTVSSVYVSVTNGSGCKANSDTLELIWRPILNKPLLTILGNDTITYVSSEQIQWYYNSSEIIGETDTIHIAQTNGFYHLQITDSYGCSINSDTLNLLAIGIEEFENDFISIYPNPSSGNVNVNFEIDNIQKIDLVNSIGKTVLSEEIIDSSKILEFDFSKFTDGIYYLKLTTSESQYLKKLILLR
ncbi:S8 family peptidase [Vicingaceae bacterium]|nr:S8 family peptidase [Vicingaceae bacterium]